MFFLKTPELSDKRRRDRRTTRVLTHVQSPSEGITHARPIKISRFGHTPNLRYKNLYVYVHDFISLDRYSTSASHLTLVWYVQCFEDDFESKQSLPPCPTVCLIFGCAPHMRMEACKTIHVYVHWITYVRTYVPIFWTVVYMRVALTEIAQKWKQQPSFRPTWANTHPACVHTASPSWTARAHDTNKIRTKPKPISRFGFSCGNHFPSISHTYAINILQWWDPMPHAICAFFFSIANLGTYARTYIQYSHNANGHAPQSLHQSSDPLVLRRFDGWSSMAETTRILRFVFVLVLVCVMFSKS